RAINAVLPACFPKRFVPAEKRQVYSAITCGLDTCTSFGGNVFVVPNAQVQLMVLNEICISDGVHAGEITYVVPIGLQPAHHGIFCIKQKSCGFKTPGVRWTVIADFKGTLTQIERSRAAI